MTGYLRKMLISCGLLAVVLATTLGFIGHVEAAIVTNKTPLQTYTWKKVYTYSNSNGGNATGYISANVDLVIINNIWANGWAYGSYPTSKGRKSAFFKMSDILSDIYATNYDAKVTRQCYAYRNATGSATIGSVYTSDVITVVGRSGGRSQIIYPISGGYKMGWIDNGLVQVNTPSNPVVTPVVRPDPVVISSPAVKTLSNGWYKILSGANGDMSLDVYGAYNAVGTNIQLMPYVGNTAQKYYLNNVGNGYFTLKPGCTDMYLDVKSGGTANGTNIQTWYNNGTASQHFRLIDASNGYYYIESQLKPNLVFDLSGSRAVAGANVQLWEKANVTWHKWKLVPVNAGADPTPVQSTLSITSSVPARATAYPPNGWYRIGSKASFNQGFDVYCSGTNEGTNIQLWSYGNANGEKFYLSRLAGTDFYTIKAGHVDKYVTLTGTNIDLRGYTGANNQKWKFFCAPGGYVYIQSAYNPSLEITLAGASTANGSNILAATYGSEDWHIWNTIGVPGPVPQEPVYDQSATAIKAKLAALMNTSGYSIGSKYTGSGQCRGFANKVYTTIFNVSSITGYTNDNFGASSYPYSTIVTSKVNFAASDTISVKNAFMASNPGYFVQIGRRNSLNSSRTAAAPHSAIIYYVDGNGVAFYEANTDRKNTIKQNYYTWETFASKNKGFTIYKPNNYSLK